MSEVKLVLRDATRDVSGTLHGSIADRIVAALSAEPETLEELATAVERFEAGGSRWLQRLRSGIDDRPHDAGVVIIDLAARLIFTSSSATDIGLPSVARQSASPILTKPFQIEDFWTAVHKMLTSEIPAGPAR